MEESIAAIEKQIEELRTERRAKILRVQSVKLELVSYHLSVIILPLGRSPYVLIFNKVKRENLVNEQIERENLVNEEITIKR